jgi:hypothetical protein
MELKKNHSRKWFKIKQIIIKRMETEFENESKKSNDQMESKTKFN